MKIKLFLILVFVMLTGCATEERYKEVLNTWIGVPESRLISVYGIPNSVYEIDGSKFLTYRTGGMGFIPGTPGIAQTTVIGNTAYTAFSGGTPGMMASFGCETTFQIINRVVERWSFRGNSCVAE